MAILTPSQLQAASNATYFDNTSGSITPTAVRALNDDWISSSVLVGQTGSMTVLSASYAGTASIALNFNPSATASYAISAGTAATATTASYALQAANANNATNADQATFASTAGTANSATTASYALNFNPAATASYALYAATASVLLGFVDSASYAANADLLDNLSSTSFVLTSSFNNFSGSIAGRVAANESSISSLNSATASYVTNAQTSSMSVANAVSASRATSALNADTASYANLAQTASYVANAQTASYVQNALSASYASNADLLDGLNFTAFVLTSSFVPFSSSVSSRLTAAPTLTGNNTFTGTNNFNVVSASFINALSASIDYLSVIYQTSSVVYSSGSNIFGDAANDTQTLWGTVNIVTGPVNVSGSLRANGGVVGNLTGTSSWSSNAVTASYIANAQTASYVRPLNQTLEVTGSVEITGAVFINNNVLQITGPGVAPGVNYGSNTLAQIVATEGAALDIFLTNGGDSIHVETISGSGTIFQDINGQTYGLETWLSIPTNAAGDNPAPQFNRGISITGSFNITGSVQGNVTSASIASNTASLNFSLGNFYTSLVSGSTNFNITNPKPGQTVNLLLTTVGVATASFSSNVKQVSGSAYTPTSGSGKNDILTFVSFDGTSVYLASVKNLI